MDDKQMMNVLGALVLHLTDNLRTVTEQAAQHGAAAPSAIVCILQYPGQTIDFLRHALSMTHSGTVRLVDRLVTGGLVTRRNGEDGRSVALFCTPLGTRRAHRVLAARISALQPLLIALDEQDKVHLEAILRKLPWTGVISETQAVNACRMCDIASCFGKGSCPVTAARKARNSEREPDSLAGVLQF